MLTIALLLQKLAQNERFTLMKFDVSSDDLNGLESVSKAQEARGLL